MALRSEIVRLATLLTVPHSRQKARLRYVKSTKINVKLKQFVNERIVIVSDLINSLIRTDQIHGNISCLKKIFSAFEGYCGYIRPIGSLLDTWLVIQVIKSSCTQ